MRILHVSGKDVAAAEFARVLRPGGCVGISDLTRSEAPLPELEGLLAWIACIADALPLQNYASVLENAGLFLVTTEVHNDVLAEMVRDVQSRLLGIEIAKGLGKLQIPGLDLAEAKTTCQCRSKRRSAGRARLRDPDRTKGCGILEYYGVKL